MTALRFQTGERKADIPGLPSGLHTHRVAATGKGTASTHYFLVDDVSGIWLLLTSAVMSHLAHTQHSLLMENPLCQVLSQLLIARLGEPTNTPYT